MQEDPKDLLSHLRSLRSSRGTDAVGDSGHLRLVQPARLPAAPAHDFADHESVREVRVAQEVGRALGIPSPYYRTVDAFRGTQVRINGNWAENFASYDYLGLNRSPEVTEAAAEGARIWGVSASSSRIAGGERSFHLDLERELADFLGTEDATVMVSGHATNLALIRTLMGKGDLVAVDTLAHNSIYEGIRAAQADHLSFPHNDWAWLDRRLDELRGSHRRVLIVVEGLYSMDGDAPDLARFLSVRDRHDCWLMVDEAHSIGVLGATGRGICEHQDIDPGTVDILMGTLSKALCSCGGFIAGRTGLCDLMRFKAPGFVYSVGLSAPNACASLAAIRQLRAQPERVTRLHSLGQYFLRQAQQAGLNCGLAEGHAVIPIMIGDSLKTAWISNGLLAAGFNVMPIITPGVPERGARLRFFLTASQEEAILDRAIAATAELVRQSADLRIDDLLTKGGA